MPNGSKVNWQSLHSEIMAQSDERHQMELRLIDAFSAGLTGIRDDMRTERETCGKRFVTIEGDIVNLKVADRRWGGIVGLFAAGVAGISAWLGQR
jgi:hypothetical protein